DLGDARWDGSGRKRPRRPAPPRRPARRARPDRASRRGLPRPPAAPRRPTWRPARGGGEGVGPGGPLRPRARRGAADVAPPADGAVFPWARVLVRPASA